MCAAAAQCSVIAPVGTYRLGDRPVNRMGYGAMRLSGAGILGPPRDREAALSVLREASAGGVNHIDTSDYLLLIPGTSVEHLRENLSAAALQLPEAAVRRLDAA